MAYAAEDYNRLIGTKGFSDTLLKNHFTLYQGYVTNTNKLIDSLAAMLKDGKTAAPEYAELKRRFGFEFNGMRLHEYYFGNMIKGGKKLDAKSKLMAKIIQDFSSFENWEKDFRATGAMRGIGWVVLYYDTTGKQLFNAWIEEHHIGHLSGAIPVLVMDVFEHAFMPDYGLARADYIQAFFGEINWDMAAQRFEGKFQQ